MRFRIIFAANSFTHLLASAVRQRRRGAQVKRRGPTDVDTLLNIDMRMGPNRFISTLERQVNHFTFLSTHEASTVLIYVRGEPGLVRAEGECVYPV